MSSISVSPTLQYKQPTTTKHTKVGRREKKGESSAWTLCSWLPSRRKDWTTIIIFFSCVSCFSWFKWFLLLVCIRVYSWFYYSPFRVFRAFRGLNDFYYSCPFVSISGSFPSMDARRNRRAGALERAIHALPSPFSSLLPTWSYLLKEAYISASFW